LHSHSVGLQVIGWGIQNFVSFHQRREKVRSAQNVEVWVRKKKGWIDPPKYWLGIIGWVNVLEFVG
jgi:hypothetical protein